MNRLLLALAILLTVASASADLEGALLLAGDLEGYLASPFEELSGGNLEPLYTVYLQARNGTTNATVYNSTFNVWRSTGYYQTYTLNSSTRESGNATPANPPEAYFTDVYVVNFTTPSVIDQLKYTADASQLGTQARVVAVGVDGNNYTSTTESIPVATPTVYLPDTGAGQTPLTKIVFQSLRSSGTLTSALEWNVTTNAAYNASLPAGEWTAILNQTNTAIAPASFTKTAGDADLWLLYAYPARTVLSTLYNETSDQPLNTNWTVQVIGSLFAQQYAFSDSSGNITVAYPDNYTLIYQVGTEPPREYYVNIEETSLNTLRLYAVDESISEYYQPVVYNQNGIACGNQTVKMLRYYVDGNAYRVVEMARTDTNGAAVLRVEPNTVAYKFQFTGTCGNYTTDPQKVTAASNAFTVTDGQSQLEALESYQSTSRSLFYNNATNTFGLNWDDPTNTVAEVCLTITGYRGLQEISSHEECLDASTGGLVYTVNDTNGTRYGAVAKFLTSSGNVFYDAASQSYDQRYENFGLTGVFLTLLVLLAFAALGSASPDTTVLFGTAAIALMGVFSVISFDWTYFAGMAVVGAYLIYKVGRT